MSTKYLSVSSHIHKIMVRIAPLHTHKPREIPPKPKKAPRLKRSGATMNLHKGVNIRKIHPKDVRVGLPEGPRMKKYKKDKKDKQTKIDIVDKMTSPVRKAADKMLSLLK